MTVTADPAPGLAAHESRLVTISAAYGAGGSVVAHLNNLVGRAAIGIDNLGAAPVDATQNWWGCATGPGTGGCSTVGDANVTTAPFLAQPVPSAGTD